MNGEDGIALGWENNEVTTYRGGSAELFEGIG